MTKEIIGKIRDAVSDLSKNLNQVRMSILASVTGHIKEAKTIDDQIIEHKCALELESKVSTLRTNILNAIEKELKSFGHDKMPQRQKKEFVSQNSTNFIGRSVRRFPKNCWAVAENELVFLSRKGNKYVSIDTIRKMWNFVKQIEFFNFSELIDSVKKSTEENPVIVEDNPAPFILGTQASVIIRFFDSFGFVKRLRKSRKTIGKKRLFKVCRRTNKELDEVISSLRRL